MPLTTKEADDRFEAQKRRIDQLFDEFGALKLLLEKNNTSLEEFIDLAKGFKFGLRILGYVEKIAVWVTKVAAGCGAVWALWKYVISETLKHLTR